MLRNLKDFQRDTVDYVFKRMYLDQDRARRFLIADEVGLGKTLVARGLISRAIDYLRDQVKRIDVIYICSNSDIARQNVSRMNVGAEQFSLASRITLLPLNTGNLTDNKLNFVSFTPSTSFDLRSRTGVMEERALLYWLLNPIWNLQGRAGPLNVFRDEAGTVNFRNLVSRFSRDRQIDPSLAEGFQQAVLRHNAEERLQERFEDLCRRFPRSDSRVSDADRMEMRQFIGRLRQLLAQTCLGALQPDLIILDEFQRFKYLLGGQNQASALAKELFEYADEHSSARVLLLSATPYKMMTLNAEAQEGDHYSDFVETLKFLYHDDSATQQVTGLLRDYRRALYRLGEQDGDTTQPLREICQRIQSQLSRVMVRTERLAASKDRNGMLVQINPPDLTLERADVEGYVGVQRVAQVLEQGDTLEYWKSAPYLLNFMEGYKLKTAVNSALDRAETAKELAKLLKATPASFLPIDEWRAYNVVDPGNARLRQLQTEMLDSGLWRLLWLPSSLPYYQLSGVFANTDPKRLTKRLVFSSWVVAPKVIAALLSYEAERRMVRSFGDPGENSPSARRRIRPLLRFTAAEGRLTGMPVLGLLYPSTRLARQLDPLDLALELSSQGGLTYPPTLDDIREHAAHRVHALLSELPDGYQSGPEDDNWYWATPILLDHKVDPGGTHHWLNQDQLPAIWSGQEQITDDGDDESGWAEHVQQAQRLLSGEIKLGRRPADLAQVITSIGIAGPGVVACRSLYRQGDDDHQPDVDVATRNAAGRVAWAFRSLFNVPEVMSLVRSQGQHQPYWRSVLDYCAVGGLQATLDEYAHVLRETLGLMGQPQVCIRNGIADAIVDALTLRSAVLSVDEFRTASDETGISLEKHSMRVRFAIRFGDQQAENDRIVARSGQVRTAFNSPFWPFILATTSVGQEGLDFHLYCHAVVHWNLPANPVDLEQREGRVHRYKGHAIRKNLASRYGTIFFSPGFGTSQHGSVPKDPWEQLFAIGRDYRESGSSDLVPYWVCTARDGAQIERHIPSFPLSRERQRLGDLLQSLTIYRLAFGQPRQEDLLEYLSMHVPEREIQRVLREFQIDLSPPRSTSVDL